MSDMSQLYMTFSRGFIILTMGAYLGGAWACLAHRRLSPWLLAVSGGFLGRFLATAIGQLVALTSRANFDLNSLVFLFAEVLGLISTIVLVFGLGAALADLRRKLALAMEPKHDRR
jgi:F0F1-type ATP synthase assembly protein I